MDFFQAVRDARTRRRGSTPILAVIVAVLAMAFATPAQAHEPYIAKAWGLNNSGQLGDGTNTGPEQCGPEKAACSTTPVEVSGLSGVVAVAGGPVLRNHFSLALLNGGKVDAWGENGSGQLGDGTTANSDVPVAVKELSGATAIAAGKEHALALLANGTVDAWGEGFRGQLGDGTTEASDVPVAVKELTGAVAVSAGGEYSLALLSSGTVEAWGANDSGQLGDGTTTNSDVPVAVSGLSGVVAISAGSRSALALLSGGTVVAWGNNPSGQLGDGTTEASDVPVAVNGLSNVGAISAGEEHGLALLKDGTVKAWGLNEKGQLGDGASTGPESCGTLPPHPCSKTPLAVSGLSGVSAVSGGGQYSLALRSDGAVEAWGANGDGQLGDGTSLGPEPCGLGACSTIPGAVSKLGGVKGISGGGQHSLAFGPPPPSVTAISPQQGKKTGAGTKVTITGAEFEEASAVMFGSTNAPSFTVNSEGSITAVAPAGKGIVDVTVETPAGKSLTSAADKFYYEPPTIKKLSPRKGPELGGTEVTISGINFTGATAVKFGSIEATSFKVKSPTEITAVSPAHAGGKVDVTVATPNGANAISSKDRFRYR